MADEPGTLKRWRALAARRPAAAAVSAAGLVAFVVLIALIARGAGSAKEGEVERTLVVRPGPFAATIALVGTISPGDSIDVTAPLAGPVKQVAFAYGAPVGRGQVLIVVDATEARQRRDEAMAAFVKAAQARAEMAAWPSSPDVSRDHRAMETAAYDLAATRRKVAETRTLLDRGLVAREEYDDLVAQQHNQELALAGARQDLAVTLARGRGADREVAALEYDETRTQLAELDTQLAGAVVRAPAAGVIVRPPADKAETQNQIHVGQQLTKGQLIGSIAGAGGLAVSFQLSETDADRLSPGQVVSVTGPGFGELTLSGRIVSVAGEASPGSASSGPLASFAATARLDPLTPDLAKTVRIGMTANIVVTVYSNPDALVVPPAAIQGTAPAAFVTVRDAGAGGVRKVAVRIGHVAPDGVEVVSGLKAGETVVWKESPEPTPAA